MDAGEGKIGNLKRAEVLVGITGGHEEGGVNFETPGAALDGALGLEAREVSIMMAHLVRYRIAEHMNGERTGPSRIPSWLCSLELVCESP